MAAIEEKNTEIATLSDFELDLKIVKTYVPDMIERTNRAMLAMSQITEITSDEMDQAANNLMVKVRNTYDVVSGKRKELTDNYDAFKKTLMLIEGELDPKKGRDNDYNRIKILREQYAQVKLDKRQKEEERLAKEKAVENKLIDLKTSLIKNIEIGPLNLMTKAESVLNDWVGGITLDNFEEKSKQLNYTPKLKQDVYESWFKHNLDMSGVEDEKVQSVIDEVRSERPYKAINESYQKDAIERLNEWKAKLPEIHKRLDEIAKADGEEKIKLEKQLAAKAAIEKKQADDKAKKLQEEKEQEIAGQANDARLETEFREQGQVQNLEEAKVNSKFVARFDQDNWVRPFAEVVYNVAIHNNFKGIYAKERNGEIKKDDKGRDQYIDHVDWFMKFFAANCDAKIEGIKIYQDAKTQARKKKE